MKAYVVLEHELNELGRGKPGATLLNFAYALLPVALTIVVARLSSAVSQTVFIVFVCAALIFGLAGVICLALGWKMSRSNAVLIQHIIGRMPPPPSIPESSPSGADAPTQEQ